MVTSVRRAAFAASAVLLVAADCVSAASECPVGAIAVRRQAPRTHASWFHGGQHGTFWRYD